MIPEQGTVVWLRFVPGWVLTGGLTGLMALAAYGLVYGRALEFLGLSLQGRVWLAGLLGGVGLAFSRAFLLVLIPFFAVLLQTLDGTSDRRSGRSRDWGALGAYLGAFALGFVVTIGGTPAAAASAIYGADWAVHRASGVVLLAWGPARLLGRLLRPSSSWALEAGSAGILGMATAMLLYHELDPAYDSAFFATGNIVAASHAPLTVAAFATGLALTYLLAAAAVRAMAASGASASPGAARAGRILGGLATALIGLAVLTGRLDAIR
jgi:hypothetical protein